MDELDACFSELFCTQLGSKVAEGSAPCLAFLAQIIRGKTDFEKPAIKDFEKSAEEVLLITAVLPDGEKHRDALQCVTTVVKIVLLCTGPDAHLQENKYKFIKETCARKSELMENTLQHISHLLDFTKYNENCAEGLDVKPDTVLALVKEMVGTCQRLVTAVYDTFKGKLDGLLFPVDIPPEVEGISQLGDITEEFLKKSFDMDSTQTISSKTVGMSTALNDLKTACNMMGMQPQDFINVSNYEVNHRACLTYLQLGLASFVRKCRTKPLLFLFDLEPENQLV